MNELDPIGEAHRQWHEHGWADAADGMALVTSLVRVQQLLMEQVEARLKPMGLTFARFEVLRLLAFTHTGSMRMTRLGSLLQVHAASVTSAVDRLEGQGYVRRERDDVDRRVVRACLTSSGRDIVETATDRLNEIFRAPGLPPAETVQLNAVLRSYRTALGD